MPYENLDPVKIENGGLSVRGGFRMDALDNLSEWDREDRSNKVVTEARGKLDKAFVTYGVNKDAIKTIDVSYSEKGWYTLWVGLR